MDISFSNVLLAVGAGVASVASPCVLPILPIVVTGTESDHRHRPLLIVVGLSLTFILMGVITSAFGSVILGKMRYIEYIAGGIILILGVLMLLNVNFFKKLHFLNNLQFKSKGRFAGFFLGLTLGLIWIPCIGPMLSGILAMVATKGQLMVGVTLLAFYSIGFSVPMLIVGYSTGLLREKVTMLQKHSFAVRMVSSSILILFGAYIITQGLV